MGNVTALAPLFIAAMVFIALAFACQDLTRVILLYGLPYPF